MYMYTLIYKHICIYIYPFIYMDVFIYLGATGSRGCGPRSEEQLCRGDRAASTGVAATVASKTREPTPLGLQSAAASDGQEEAASSCQETSVRTFARLCRQECDTHCNALQHPATLCR